MTILSKNKLLLTALISAGAVVFSNAQTTSPNYKYKKYIPAVNVVDSPVTTPTDPQTPVTPQYGTLTFGASTVSFPVLVGGDSAAVSVVASNLTDKPVTAANISITGGFSVSYNCEGVTAVPALVAPGKSCTFEVTGTSSSSSAKSGTLSVAYQSTGSAAVSVVMPRGLAPSRLESGVSSIVIAGGNGISTEYGSVMLLNSGEQTADISSIAIQGGGFTADQTCLSSNNGALTSNTTCVVTVSGVGAVSAKNANLVVTYNTDKTLVIPVTQLAAINNEGGVLSASPTSLTFDAKDVGLQESKTFTITNTADWGTTVKSVTVPQNSAYTTAVSCPSGSSLPAILQKDQTCTITVTSTSQASAQSTTVAVGYNSTSLGVGVSTPAGLAPTADTDVGSLAFGYFNQHNQLNVSKNVVLKNNGTKTLGVNGVSLTGANTAAYSQTNTCLATLVAGASCTVTVTAQTANIGDFSANVSISTDLGTKLVPMTSSVRATSASTTGYTEGNAGSVSISSDALSPKLTTGASLKLYDATDTTLLASSNSASWSSGTNSFSGTFTTVAPAAGLYTFRVYDASNVLLTKTTATIYKPTTVRILDTNNTSIPQVDFGQVGVPSQKTFRLSNHVNSKTTLSITNVAVTGAPFSMATSVTNPLGGAVCSSLTSASIPPGGSCDYTVNLAQVDGAYTSGYSITVTSNAEASIPSLGSSSVVIPVKGTVVSTVDSNYGATIALLDASSGSVLNKAPGGTVTFSSAAPTVVATPSKTSTKSIYFSGSNYLDIGSNLALGTGDYTIEAWYYYISDTNGDLFIPLVANTAPRIRSMGASIEVFDSAGNTYYSGLTSNTWTHVALVRKAGVSTFYKNGVASLTFTDSNNYSTPLSARIGNTAGWGYYIKGNVEQFRITKAARYTANFTPSPFPLAAAATGTDSTSYATGGTVTYNGNYAIHTFYGNGTFQFTNAPIGNTATAYVVGGGSGAGTGGGAGGAVNTFTLNSTQVAAGTSYNVTIGAGGLGAIYPGSTAIPSGGSGGTTSFGSMTATGGGGGGGYGDRTSQMAKAGTAGAGGGGGACAGSGQGAFVVGGTVTGGGFAGGNGTAIDGAAAGGGGGGAGAAGTNASGATPGNGGAGKTVTYISGGTATFGAGAGGMPCNGTNAYPVDAGPNTGNGGKAALSPRGGNGGSGVVIVIYQYK